jgi:hypothetical protein
MSTVRWERCEGFRTRTSSGSGELLVNYLVAGLVVGELQELVDGPVLRQELRRRGHLLRLGGRGLGRRRLLLGGRLVRGVVVSVVGATAVGAAAARRGAEADADAGGEVPLVVAGERAGGVDGLVAVPAEERPVLHAEDEGRLLLHTQTQ